MAEKNKPSGNRSEASREDRLKAALKANMARRKAQAKARTTQKDDASRDAKG
ncbi:hypothetical protein R1T40_18265 [Tritonibacter scottomollicae]|uniref:Uncharacterized protein n=1 Tax=Tritonibacter scottomollicae TaxID=483013 RepID=A0ABZ0HDE9_TRISK|nr:hypothetical protein R1T40_18265 [Tritonibacter scottomollicae]